MHLRDLLLGTTMLRDGPNDPPAAPPATPPATPPTAPPPAEPPAPETPPVTPPVAVAPPEPVDWKVARIAELTAKVNAKQRELDALKAAPPTPATPPVAPIAGETPEQFDARVNARAAELAAAESWDRQCIAVAEAGNKEFPDFGDRLKAVQGVVNAHDPIESAQFNQLISAAIETGEAHKLIHQLGETPGEVTRLMRLPPLKMAMEVAKAAAKFGASAPAEPPSGAPKPIVPVGSKGNHYDGIKADDAANGTKLPIGEWMKQREAQVRERGMQ